MAWFLLQGKRCIMPSQRKSPACDAPVREIEFNYFSVPASCKMTAIFSLWGQKKKKKGLDTFAMPRQHSLNEKSLLKELLEHFLQRAAWFGAWTAVWCPGDRRRLEQNRWKQTIAWKVLKSWRDKSWEQGERYFDDKFGNEIVSHEHI